MELAQINLLLTRINQELKSKFTDEKFYNRYIDQQLIVQKFENNTIYIIIADQFGKKELENQ
jgi:hypothetical protein